MVFGLDHYFLMGTIYGSSFVNVLDIIYLFSYKTVWTFGVLVLCLVITVPADGMAPYGARPSADTVLMTKLDTAFTKLVSLNINPLRAKFLRENIKMYLHFMSFLHTDNTQVVEIPPWVRQGLAYIT